MENIKSIEKYISTLSFNERLLKLAKKQYVELKKELQEYGCYISRVRCTYTLDELNYGIKLINLKLSILKNNN